MMILTKRRAFMGAFTPLIALACLSLAACDDTASQPLPPTATSLNGDWVRAGEVPGSSERWTVTLTGTHIVAGGTWTGEACCAGNISGAGSVSGDSIHLDLSFFDGSATTGTPRFTEHVDAVQSTMDDIVGTALHNNVSEPIHMQRAVYYALSAGGGR